MQVGLLDVSLPTLASTGEVSAHSNTLLSPFLPWKVFMCAFWSPPHFPHPVSCVHGNFTFSFVFMCVQYWVWDYVYDAETGEMPWSSAPFPSNKGYVCKTPLSELRIFFSLGITWSDTFTQCMWSVMYEISLRCLGRKFLFFRGCAKPCVFYSRFKNLALGSCSSCSPLSHGSDHSA